MIVGAFIINKSEVISRFTDLLLPSKIELFILDFMQNKKSDIYKYISIINNNISYVLVTSLSYREVRGKKILQYLINNSTLDPVDQLVTLDNILYDDLFISPNLSLIKNMESQEEKIYNMMMKNKANEMKKKYNKMKKSSNEENNMKEKIENMNSNSNMKDISNSMINNTTINNNTINNNTINSNINKLRSFETSKNNIFILIKEKLKCQVDIENNIKSVEINGEMILNIKSEEYKNISLTLKGDTSKCKFSPKLDKEAYKNNIIRSNKDFSLNKNIALMKWKKIDIKENLLTFTFWPSEVKLGTYQVSLEYTAEEDLKDLVINIPKKKMIDCNVICKETEENIEWNVGTVKKGDSDTLDFQCKCNDIEDIFPMEVYFTSEKVNSKIDIEDDLEDCEIRRVLEVEEFKLEYE